MLRLTVPQRARWLVTTMALVDQSVVGPRGGRRRVQVLLLWVVALAAGLSIAYRLASEQRVPPYFDVSPDGRTIAFLSGGRGGVADVFLLDMSSGLIRRLTDTPGAEGLPSFTPDGRAVVHPYGGPDGQQGLWLRAVDGTGLRAITSNAPDAGSCDIAPAVSPDGQLVGFARSTRHSPRSMGSGWGWYGWDLHTVRLDGQDLHRLTHVGSYEPMTARWLPHGQGLVTDLAEAGTSTSVLARCGADGKLVPLPSVSASEPDATPDGRLLVYVSDQARPNRYELWTTSTDGQAHRQLTHLRRWAREPRVHPWGREVLFLSMHPGTPRALWCVRLDNGHAQELVTAFGLANAAWYARLRLPAMGRRARRLFGNQGTANQGAGY